MIKKLLVTVTCLILLSGSALAVDNSIELTFNDDSAQARLNTIINQDAYGTSLLDFRGLYNDDDDQSAWMASAGFNFVGEPGTVPGLELGIVADVKTGDTDRQNSDFGAVGLGGLVRYYPPALGGFGFGGRVVYSPKIFTFLEAERLFEISTRAGFMITPKIGVHVEFQKVNVEFEGGGDYDLDEDLRIGFNARF
jgi:hypothetical protein